MSTSLEQTWQSGDWVETPRRAVPYNGLQITGLPTYDSSGKLIGVALTFLDCTNNPKGVSSTISQLTAQQEKVSVPAPMLESSPPASPPIPTANPDFTVEGQVALEAQLSMLYLRLMLSYGTEDHREQELGYIMGFQQRIEVTSPPA